MDSEKNIRYVAEMNQSSEKDLRSECRNEASNDAAQTPGGRAFQLQ